MRKASTPVLRQMSSLNRRAAFAARRRFSSDQSTVARSHLIAAAHTSSDDEGHAVKLTYTNFGEGRGSENGSHSAKVSRRSNNASVELREVNQLVDTLLQRTSDMMTFEGTNLLAFSGGVDSSLVAALLQQCHTTQQSSRTSDKVQAVLGVSPAVAPDQIDMARRVAEHIGIDLIEVSTNEQSDPVYVENEGQSCWACKTHLYTALQAVSRHATEQHTKHMSTSNHASTNAIHLNASSLTLFNGTNSDDTFDSTRVGLVAAKEFNVQSPLDAITKNQVREASKHLGLPNWNMAASPCLRSRLAFGVQATEEHLSMVHRAETKVRHVVRQILKDTGIYDEHTTNLRVRLLARNRAAVELDKTLLSTPLRAPREGGQHAFAPSPITLLHELKSSRELEIFFLDELQLDALIVRPFKSGSVAAVSTSAAQAKKK
jgi:uncharacterized protein